MSGKAARRKGHDFEREIARLTELRALDEQQFAKLKASFDEVVKQRDEYRAGGMRNTAISLAKVWVSVHDWWYTGLKLDGQELKDHYINYPVLQGMRNQMNVRKIAEMPVEKQLLQEELDKARQAGEGEGDG